MPRQMETAVALFNQRRYREAEQIARGILLESPNHGFAWKVLGAALDRQGRKEESLGPMRKSAELMPKDAEAHNNLGIILQSLGRMIEAEACYRRALEVKPDSLEARRNLGSLLGRSEEGDGVPEDENAILLEASAPDDWERITSPVDGNTAQPKRCLAPPGTPPIKIGVIAPTYNRPDFARLLALQLENQSLHPHLVAFHQNGTPNSYEWAVSDVKRHYSYVWLHTKEILPQVGWYSRPLAYLLEQGCTHFFWCDHDDIYHANHLAYGMELLLLPEHDFIITQGCDVLLLEKPYRFLAGRKARFSPVGMSSSMCFNRPFAKELLRDFTDNETKSADEGKHLCADRVVWDVTVPKFRCLTNYDAPTTIYVCHADTVSSPHWLKK